jgi:hypothetical protein
MVSKRSRRRSAGTHQELLELQRIDGALDCGKVLGQGIALEELLIFGLEKRITRTALEN